MDIDQLSATSAERFLKWRNVTKERDWMYPFQEKYEYFGDWPKGANHWGCDGYESGEHQIIPEYAKNNELALRILEGKFQHPKYLWQIQKLPSGKIRCDITWDGPTYSGVGYRVAEAICEACLASAGETVKSPNGQGK